MNDFIKKNYIGKSVRYFDYMELERFGRIVGVEPYHDDIYYIYIEDEENEYNVHSDIVDGIEIDYAELRLSTEINLIRNR